MTESPFMKLSGGGFAKPVAGHLWVIVRVHGIKQVHDTTFDKDVDEAMFDYADLDDVDQSLRERQRSTNVGIVNKLSEQTRWAIGYIRALDTGKGNPAWILEDASDNTDAVRRALGWKGAYEAGQIGSLKQPEQAAPVPVIAAPPPLTAEQVAALLAANPGLAQQAGVQPAPAPAQDQPRF